MFYRGDSLRVGGRLGLLIHYFSSGINWIVVIVWSTHGFLQPGRQVFDHKCQLFNTQGITCNIVSGTEINREN